MSKKNPMNASHKGTDPRFRASVGPLVLILAAFASALALPAAYKAAIFHRQSYFEENAIWNAMAALEEGNLDEARSEVNYLLNRTVRDRPNRQKALGYLQPYYLDLADRLREADLRDLADAMTWKALRYYHRASRPLLYLRPWLAMQSEYYRRGDTARFAQVFEMLVSESSLTNLDFVESVRDVDRDFYIGLLPYLKLREFATSIPPREYASLSRRYRNRFTEPNLRLQVDLLKLKGLIEMQDKQQAQTLMRQMRNYAPDRLEIDAMEAKLEKGLDARDFADALSKDPSWKVLRGADAAADKTEYFGKLSKLKTNGDGSVIMEKKSAVVFDVEVEKPADLFYLAAFSQEALDIFPIVWASVDGGEVFPLYIDSYESEIHAVNLPLEPGRHRIRLEFLNRYQEEFYGEVRTRRFWLQRLILPQS